MPSMQTPSLTGNSGVGVFQLVVNFPFSVTGIQQRRHRTKTWQA